MTRAEFLKRLGESLAPYQAARVARIGCFFGLGLLALTVVAGVAGLVDASPIFPRFIRILVLTVLGGVLVVFAVFAVMEGSAERRAMRELRDYLSKGEADLETLLEMARTREGRFPGSDRVIDLLIRASEEPSTNS